MDFTNMTPEEVKKLPLEEKREFVRNLIHSEAAGIHAAFFNPSTGKSMTMSELAKQIGEEEAIDAIVKMLDSAESSAITMTKDEIKELLLKAKRGECTEHELHMLEYITSEMEDSDNIQFERSFMELLIDLINFSQNGVPYEPQLHDVYSVLIVTTIISMINADEGVLTKYDNGDGPMISEMATTIADDIYDTWKASCTSPVDTELVIIGLLQLAAKLAYEEGYKFSKAELLADAIGLELPEVEPCSDCECKDCECEVDEASVQDTENGSNAGKVCQPIVHDPSDENMRNLLKDN